MKYLVLLLVILPEIMLPAAVRAQEPDTLEMTLPEVTVDAVRETQSAASAPYALAVEIRQPDELAYEPALSLERVLRTLPGVWINDRGHFALGERISVRGMGARAAFGVRGLQVLLDGIPLTMPDGQAVLDIVEPTVLRRTELLRSPASLFWGNGSGAVLFLSSAARPEVPRIRARALAGSFGQNHLLVEGAVPFAEHDLQFYASNLEQDGYRDYSAGAQRRAGTIGRFRLGPASQLRTVAAVAIQDTENPSSLTREQVEEDPRMARPDYPETRSGKESVHAQLGATLEHEAPLGSLSVTGYGVRRLLDNPLPFAYIDVDRTAGGLRGALRGDEGRLQWGLGADGALQHDVRRNFNNAAGEPGDDVDLDQTEDVLSAGAFVFGGIDLTPRLNATAGVRYSAVRFEMDDQLLANDDQSGSRQFAAWSPTVGLSYRHGALLIFANYGTAFETPTTTELVNRPDMTGGFNPDLDPQISRGFETGVRGALGSALFIDLAAFYARVDGRLVSFENELGREYFRNAGENTHQGIEAAVEWIPLPAWQLTATYSGTRLVFEEDELSGNLLPGVPEHRLYAGIQTDQHGFWGRVEAEAVSEYFVDDANTEVNDGYAVFDVSIGHEGIAFGNARLEPFLTLRNLFDTQYNSSVLVNAFGGRYYEPAPGRAILAGFQLNLLP